MSMTGFTTFGRLAVGILAYRGRIKFTLLGLTSSLSEGTTPASHWLTGQYRNVSHVSLPPHAKAQLIDEQTIINFNSFQLNRTIQHSWLNQRTHRTQRKKRVKAGLLINFGSYTV
jgi:hypothetical protein